MKVKVLENQSFFDLAVQLLGSADAAFALAQKNGMSVTDTIETGSEVTYSSDMIINARVGDYFYRNKLYPCHSIALTIDSRTFDETFDLTFN